MSTLSNGYSPPNSRIPDIVIHFTGFFAPRSFHSGGALEMMGDGSVRFVSETIDAAVHRGLHSSNGGEAVAGS
jgi:hypothetical protein